VDFPPAFAQIGTLYNRAIRDHKNCWFLHDSYFDERMTTQFLKSKASKQMLKKFATLLPERNTLFTPDVSSRPLVQDSQGFMEISEETPCRQKVKKKKKKKMKRTEKGFYLSFLFEKKTKKNHSFSFTIKKILKNVCIHW